MMIIGNTTLIAKLAAAMLYSEDLSRVSHDIEVTKVDVVHTKAKQLFDTNEARIDAMVNTIDENKIWDVVCAALDGRDEMKVARAKIAKVRKAQREYREARMNA